MKLIPRLFILFQGLYFLSASVPSTFQISSAICFLRGKAYEALENRAQARQWCVTITLPVVASNMSFLVPCVSSILLYYVLFKFWN